MPYRNDDGSDGHLNLDDRPTLAPAVKTLLGELRRRIRQYVWLDGLAAAVAWLGAAFWVTLAADWFFEPSTAVRGVMLAVVAAVLAVVVVRLIGRRAFVRVTDGNAAMVLERRFPALERCPADGRRAWAVVSGRLPTPTTV